ncbi:MAG TPA: T9SS type A sorting domain-containing protein [Bacteroidia bacterium]|nr:T9SS type A sorting domain-containing protein [Bacteroidia bacterium]
MFSFLRNTSFYVLLFIASVGFSQSTYSWASYTAGSLTYTTGVMTSSITVNQLKAWGNGYSSPQYHSNTTLGSGTCGIAGNLGLEVFFGNTTTAYIQQVLDFTNGNTQNGVCEIMTFTIGDINSDAGSTVSFHDIVEVSALDATGAAISPSVSGSGMSISGTTTKVIQGNNSGGCNKLAVSITPPSGIPLKSITIKYYPDATNGCNTSGFYNFTSGCTSNGSCGSCFRPAMQWISVTAITGTASSSCTITLPVELKSFKGKSAGAKKTFNWVTATEANNSYFTLEKSVDGELFESVSKITGNGNSAKEMNYTYTYEESNNDYTYYRLKQTDFNGRSRILNAIYLNDIDVVGGLKLYPNPASSILNVVFEAAEELEFTICVTDMLGRVQQTSKYLALKGANEVPLVIEDLAKGSYHVTITNNNGSRPKTLKFFKGDN